MQGATTALAQAHVAQIDWAVIEHPHNEAASGGRGRVDYVFRISKLEINNLQYSIFLNNVARRDTHQLFDTRMETEPCGGIDRKIEGGKCFYNPRPGFEQLPVVFVSYMSAVRFVNWLHNGHDSTETETGAYDLGKPEIRRSPSAKYWIPTEDEWCKAAYFDPAKQGRERYWKYPFCSDTEPVGGVSSTVLGKINRPQYGLPASADFVYSGQGRNVLLPSEAGSGVPSPLGTYHQGGNVAEWVDGFLKLGYDAHLQIARGGGWHSPLSALAIDEIELHPRSFASPCIGFRVASKPLYQAPLAGAHK